LFSQWYSWKIAHFIWFSLDTPISSTNKNDRHNILVTKILLKVALNTISQTNHYHTKKQTLARFDLLPKS
jgi:hypothetical protein